MRILDAIVCHTLTMSAYLFFFVFCRGKLKQVDNLKAAIQQGTFIIAPNHVSYLDWLFLWALFRYRYGIKIRFLAKEKLFDHPLWGMLMRHSNCIRVNNDGTKILDESGAEALLNTHIGVFPEGKRSREGNLLPFKSGVLVFAKKYNKAILPIGLKGFYECWPSHQKSPKITKLTVHFGRLMLPEKIEIDKASLNLLKASIYMLANGGNDKVIYENYTQKWAFIDVDNTLTNTNIGSLLFFIKKQKISPFRYFIWKSFFLFVVTPILLLLDKLSRPYVQIFVYWLYRNYTEEFLTVSGKAYVTEHLQAQLLPDTLHIIEKLKANKSKIVLVSTNLNHLVQPIAAHLNVQYKAIDLVELKQLTLREKISYLHDFKESYMSKNQYDNSIGIGDSKYDLAILKHTSRALLRAKKGLKLNQGIVEVY